MCHFNGKCAQQPRLADEILRGSDGFVGSDRDREGYGVEGCLDRDRFRIRCPAGDALDQRGDVAISSIMTPLANLGYDCFSPAPAAKVTFIPFAAR